VNFTREPIIETIISPRDGYKLCIRNSKATGAEELFVDAVEVVSFGNSLFFRSTERPKPFLVPVSDYEVFEVKETRVVLKNIAHDRNIKIGGGRDASLRSSKESTSEKKEEELEEVKEPSSPALAEAAAEPKNDRKRDRRSRRRRRLAEEKKEWMEKEKTPKEEEGVFEEKAEDQESVEDSKPSVPITFTHLLPPPPVLISERLSKMKEKELAESSSLESYKMDKAEPTLLEEPNLDSSSLEEDDQFPI
jgi:hypothetical protein